ncbi:hypothetical protein KQX54_019173 [Cotesia glomerata]|uniref:Uncharacterized protein n=1 Tax=Cotesia glomerata TaxID=32391 RepID=A0AAV7J0K7_COTGL|nr:hypothetical protein KQX54_019173 [Cotesia glomerata]
MELEVAEGYEREECPGCVVGCVLCSAESVGRSVSVVGIGAVSLLLFLLLLLHPLLTPARDCSHCAQEYYTLDFPALLCILASGAFALLLLAGSTREGATYNVNQRN